MRKVFQKQPIIIQVWYSEACLWKVFVIEYDYTYVTSVLTQYGLVTSYCVGDLDQHCLG